MLATIIHAAFLVFLVLFLIVATVRKRNMKARIESSFWYVKHCYSEQQLIDHSCRIAVAKQEIKWCTATQILIWAIGLPMAFIL